MPETPSDRVTNDTFYLVRPQEIEQGVGKNQLHFGYQRVILGIVELESLF